MTFGMGPRGPQLALFLPPADGDEWSGVLRVTALRLSQTIRFQHLAKGQRFVFALADGQWAVTPEGDVSERYLERIHVGPQMLAEEQNLFDASQDFGRQILPGEPLTAGDVVWWISRNEVTVPARLRDLVSLSREADAKAWFVCRITLAPILDAGRDRDAVAGWLQRPIRPKRARVWIEEPWPTGRSALGVPIFNPIDGAILIQSDQNADIALRSVYTGELVLRREMVQEARWADVRPGYWELLVNGYVHELLQVSADEMPTPANIVVQVNGASAIDFTCAQVALSNAFEGGGSSCQLDLAWREDSIGDLIFLNGKRLQSHDICSMSISVRPGYDLVIGNLGAASWAARNQEDRPLSQIDADMRSRAVWLLSVASSRRSFGGHRVRVPVPRQHDPILRRLMSASWSNRFAAQVRALQRLLEIAT